MQLELDGTSCDKHKKNGVKVDSTGGNFIYLTPGIHFRPNKNFDISAGIAYMVMRDNNYDSATKTGGLSEDTKIIVRVGYNF